ncbi:hypothetical protein GDO78_008791 [Eleutherodactylus coqui]|uniref:Secreted protein n=1 Tax=Eleutherodactylus coqui TaxID=57060 RepID=A0A8J6FDW0_ELECQ|nr:hypothetical protein GDO78_008791 [Eleutherodactylus coqui]
MRSIKWRLHHHFLIFCIDISSNNCGYGEGCGTHLVHRPQAMQSVIHDPLTKCITRFCHHLLCSYINIKCVLIANGCCHHSCCHLFICADYWLLNC